MEEHTISSLSHVKFIQISERSGTQVFQIRSYLRHLAQLGRHDPPIKVKFGRNEQKPSVLSCVPNYSRSVKGWSLQTSKFWTCRFCSVAFDSISFNIFYNNVIFSWCCLEISELNRNIRIPVVQELKVGVFMKILLFM